MMASVERGSVVPLLVTAQREGEGPTTGLVPLVAMRRAGVAGYLDFADGQWKTSGWTTRKAPLTEVDASLSPGVYQRTLDLGTIAAPMGTVLVAEYELTDAGVAHIASDTFVVVGTKDSLTLMEKWMRNRLEEAAGDPGTLILYDDDDTTPLLTWNIRDGQGGPTGFVPLRPARRSKAV